MDTEKRGCENKRCCEGGWVTESVGDGCRGLGVTQWRLRIVRVLGAMGVAEMEGIKNRGPKMKFHYRGELHMSGRPRARAFVPRSLGVTIGGISMGGIACRRGPGPNPSAAGSCLRRRFRFSAFIWGQDRTAAAVGSDFGISEMQTLLGGSAKFQEKNNAPKGVPIISGWVGLFFFATNVGSKHSTITTTKTRLILRFGGLVGWCDVIWCDQAPMVLSTFFPPHGSARSLPGRCGGGGDGRRAAGGGRTVGIWHRVILFV